MSKETFLKSITVLDTETTNLYPEQAEIVEIAGARYNGQEWLVSSMLLGAVNGIPPEASAKNNISNRMIEGLPTFNQSTSQVKSIFSWDNSRYFVAHNCKYDQTVLATAWLACGSENDATVALDQKNWICTYRLAKKLLDFDFGNMQYNLSYLRYKFDLPVPDDTTVHRAGADTLVCAILFEFLVDYALALDKVVDGENLGDQLHALCWDPIPITVWPFGKNKGKKLSEIPTDYYVWAMENMDALNEDKSGYDADLAASVAAELETRLA
jgi:DNA polymerase III epsilon subunit-like protein